MTAKDVMKTGDVTMNFNKKLRLYLSFKELNFFSTLLHLTACRHSFAFI